MANRHAGGVVGLDSRMTLARSVMAAATASRSWPSAWSSRDADRVGGQPHGSAGRAVRGVRGRPCPGSGSSCRPPRPPQRLVVHRMQQPGSAADPREEGHCVTRLARNTAPNSWPPICRGMELEADAGVLDVQQQPYTDLPRSADQLRRGLDEIKMNPIRQTDAREVREPHQI